jgi:hypothetical protein
MTSVFQKIDPAYVAVGVLCLRIVADLVYNYSTPDLSELQRGVIWVDATQLAAVAVMLVILAQRPSGFPLVGALLMWAVIMAVEAVMMLSSLAAKHKCKADAAM